MDTNYLSELENNSMKNRLLVLDNISAIEDLLDKESIRLERLERLKKDNKLDLGKKLSSKELKELFPKICTEVDEFLGIQNGEVPKYEYYDLMTPGLNTTPILICYALTSIMVAGSVTSLFIDKNPGTHYIDAVIGTLQFTTVALLDSINRNRGSRFNQSSKKVTLEKIARTDLIPTIGHEYAHSVQDRQGLIYKKHSIFQEGHARGVEKHLAQMYSEREDNEAFLYDTSKRTVGEFKRSYLWMCTQLGQEPNKNLLKTNNDINDLGKKIKEPSSHAIGNALFSIYKAQKGSKIYNQMIHGNFQFI